MEIANKTINTRIKLKSDTEANWQLLAETNDSPGFIPLNGEVIIYSTDASHSYPRLKIGDGSHNVNTLPFIDSGTLNGESDFISKYTTMNDFPNPGSSKKLYIDLSTGNIYHCGANGYQQLMNFTLDITTAEMANIVSWDAGKTTKVAVEDNTLTINNGRLPELLYYNTMAVVSVAKGENE